MIMDHSTTSSVPRWLRVLTGLCLAAGLPLGLAYCGTDVASPPVVAPDEAVATIREMPVPAPRTDVLRDVSEDAERVGGVVERPLTRTDFRKMAGDIEQGVAAGDLTPGQAREKRLVLEKLASAVLDESAVRSGAPATGELERPMKIPFDHLAAASLECSACHLAETGSAGRSGGPELARGALQKAEIEYTKTLKALLRRHARR